MSIPALNSAAMAMQNFQKQISVLANDVSNSMTTAAKKHVLETTDLFYTTLRKAGIPNANEGTSKPVGIQVGNGAKINGIYRINQQGAPKSTSRPLDVMINGAGYIAVQIANGVRAYTRAGSFSLDNQKRIVTSDGHLVGDDEIQIPADIPQNKVIIGNDGIVSVIDANNQQQQIGQIQLYTFPNERGLEEIGGGLLLETEEGSGLGIPNIPGEDGAGLIQQYMLEESNIDTVEVMERLMEAQRGMELANNIMRSANEIEKDIAKTNT